MCGSLVQSVKNKDNPEIDQRCDWTIFGDKYCCNAIHADLLIQKINIIVRVNFFWPVSLLQNHHPPLHFKNVIIWQEVKQIYDLDELTYYNFSLKPYRAA